MIFIYKRKRLDQQQPPPRQLSEIILVIGPPVHIDFLTENVDEIVKRIIKLGGKHESGERGDWGTIAYCSDPFGNGFCVINE
ncbi:VOC family protein [Microbulbifer sp. EKSA005]|uniref:VOC family protein n=1 Tax=Microbulbifer sp. EKSA005 TaxID=3243364 RepID=UPI0040426230